MEIIKNGTVAVKDNGDIEINDFHFDGGDEPACYVKMAELATEYAILALQKNLKDMKGKKDEYNAAITQES